MVFQARVLESAAQKALARKHRRRIREIEYMILGDENGRVLDARFPGMMIVRQDADAIPEYVQWSGLGAIPTGQPGTIVEVVPDRDGVRRIQRVEPKAYSERRNLNALNSAEPALSWLRENQYAPLKCVAVSTATTLSPDVVVWEGFWSDDTYTTRSFPRTRVSLAAYFPLSSEDHCLAVICVKQDDSVEVVTSTPQDTLLELDASDYTEAIQTKAPRSKPVGVYVLRGSRTIVTEADKWSGMEPRFLLHPEPVRNRWDATTTPGATDDSDSGYGIGSQWVDVSGLNSYVCVADTPGTAVWKTTTASGGSGTVTSVDLSLPGEFAVAGNPITGSGAFTVTKADQAVHTVYAGPVSGGAAVPTFRLLDAADIPVLTSAKLADFATAVTGVSAVSQNTTHRTASDNPHSVTPLQLGLGYALEVTNLAYTALTNGTETVFNGFNTTPTVNTDGGSSIFTAVAADGVTCAVGTYRVTVQIYYTGSNTRFNVALQVSVDGVAGGAIGAGGYLRNTGGHNEASNSVSRLVTLATPAKIGFTHIQNAGAANTITMPAGNSSMILEKLA